MDFARINKTSGALRPAEIRAVLWAARAVRSTRRQLRRRPVTSLVLPRAPRVSPGCSGAVDRVLGHSGATCLERSLVLQRWLAGQGIARDLLIGVRVGTGGFAAHAWLEGDPQAAPFREILRLPG